jgi:hypothetical protein
MIAIVKSCRALTKATKDMEMAYLCAFPTFVIFVDQHC